MYVYSCCCGRSKIVEKQNWTYFVKTYKNPVSWARVDTQNLNILKISKNPFLIWPTFHLSISISVSWSTTGWGAFDLTFLAQPSATQRRVCDKYHGNQFEDWGWAAFERKGVFLTPSLSDTGQLQQFDRLQPTLPISWRFISLFAFQVRLWRFSLGRLQENINDILITCACDIVVFSKRWA